MAGARFLFSLWVYLAVSCQTQQKSVVVNLPNNTQAKDYISEHSDSGFGGYYLNIDKTMQNLGITRLQAHEIQNQMRDLLETRSESYSLIEQGEYLEGAFETAVDNVLNRKIFESGLSDLSFEKGEFAIVLDLDETVLAQWYQKGLESNSSPVMTFATSVPDTVPNWVDDATGNSLDSATLSVSPSAVMVRPGVEEFFTEVSALPGFKGFIIFTAKEDKAAWAVVEKWRQESGPLSRYMLGLFTRNYLKFDGGLSKASKDLRIFDPNLKQVFMVDDNETRVVQKELNYQVPKFNADVYLENRSKDVEVLNEKVLPFIASVISSCAKSVEAPVVECLKRKIGSSDEGTAGLAEYLKVMSTALSRPWTLEEARTARVFEPDFVLASQKHLDGDFPRFRNGVMQQETSSFF
ncbi:MAG: NIF family HAD-type phosphatase [Oligoflexales bacterium]